LEDCSDFSLMIVMSMTVMSMTSMSKTVMIVSESVDPMADTADTNSPSMTLILPEVADLFEELTDLLMGMGMVAVVMGFLLVAF
jgi:hypothetical protein